MELSSSNKHLISGTLGGFMATAALYPMDLIKTRMQVTSKKEVESYRNIRSTIKSVIESEGIKGFYKGMTPAVFAASVSWGGYFFFYENAKKRRGSSPMGTLEYFASATEAGIIMVMFTNPLWLIRTRLALQGASQRPLNSNMQSNNSREYRGFSDAFRTILREEGIRGLYRGSVPAILLTSHGSIQFSVYEYLKFYTTQYFGEDKPAWVSMVTGSISKVAAAVATYPYQVIKSRLQQRESGISQENGEPKYRNVRHCFQMIWKNEGVAGFFRGVWVNAIKVAPSAAITFVVYEESLSLLSKF